MICSSYGTSRTVNFWSLVLSKNIICCREIFHGFSRDRPCGTYRRGFKMADRVAKMPTILKTFGKLFFINGIEICPICEFWCFDFCKLFIGK